MKLSLYTFVRDGLRLDFHVVDMLRHHLDFADEIVINEGYSTDGTYEAISAISPKIRIERNHWDRSDPKTWSIKFRNRAREMCTGDWCILLDADEFIPEWEFERIRRTLEATDELYLELEYVNFYGNYRVYHAEPRRHGWPLRKRTVHRNLPEFEAWGDGANVRLRRREQERVGTAKVAFTCHHFGFVRHAARLREKWRNQFKRNLQGRWDWMPAFVFDLLPHRWDDPDLMPHMRIYDGPLIAPVRANPAEYVRDDYRLLRLLGERERRDVDSLRLAG